MAERCEILPTTGFPLTVLIPKQLGLGIQPCPLLSKYKNPYN
jgi:hypothetical protein